MPIRLSDESRAKDKSFSSWPEHAWRTSSQPSKKSTMTSPLSLRDPVLLKSCNVCEHADERHGYAVPFEVIIFSNLVDRPSDLQAASRVKLSPDCTTAVNVIVSARPEGNAHITQTRRELSHQCLQPQSSGSSGSSDSSKAMPYIISLSSSGRTRKRNAVHCTLS